MKPEQKREKAAKLRAEAERLYSEAAHQEWCEQVERDLANEEAALIKRLGIECHHDTGGGYCAWVLVNGEREERCPLANNKRACTRAREWPK